MHMLILGASYGSLFATKLLLSGRRVTLVCTRGTAELINREGTMVRFPVKGREGLLEVRSKQLPGSLRALAPEEVEAGEYDLAVLGMQETQYGGAGVKELMGRLGRSKVPCLAIMNMPPLPYLKRLVQVRTDELEGCYTDPRVWDEFEAGRVTLASPDPQAFRPPGEAKNVLEVGLATNFKAARFAAEEATALLRELERGIESARFEEDVEIPVKLRVHESLLVPLAKWPMLMAGNYRCIRRDGMISIREAVHGNVEAARVAYEWTGEVCRRLGAEDADLVPFEKYAKAAETLTKPSSAARTLCGGAGHIERVDCLVRRVAGQVGMRSPAIDEMVAIIDERLAANRAAVRGEGQQA